MGFLVGLNTSGSDLENNMPYVEGSSTPCQDWDFISPLIGDSMGFATDQAAKFEQICMSKLRCPDNGLSRRPQYLRLGPGEQHALRRGEFHALPGLGLYLPAHR